MTFPQLLPPSSSFSGQGPQGLVRSFTWRPPSATLAASPTLEATCLHVLVLDPEKRRHSSGPRRPSTFLSAESSLPWGDGQSPWLAAVGQLCAWKS